MDFLWKCTLLFACLQLNFISINSAMKASTGSGLSPTKFGPIAVTNIKLEICKGPKRKDCCHYTMTRDGNNSVEFVTEIPKNIQYDKIKIAVYVDNNDTKSAPDIVKWIYKPCQHFFVAPFLTAQQKTNLKTCVTSKGIYTTRFDPSTLTASLFGGQFFYGTYRAHTIVLGKDCNIMCMDSQFVFEKPNSIKT